MNEHEVNAAIPAGAVPVDKGLLRAFLAKRPPYVFAAVEDPQTFDPVDAVSGAVTLTLGFDGRFFFYDPDDTTSAHDGVTVLVTENGERYKVEETMLLPFAVTSATVAAQPGTPILGDAYAVPAAATGDDWAGHDDDIAVFTARGWRFVAPSVGRIVFVEDEAGYRHYTPSGDWTKGLGDSVLSAQAVKASNINGGRTHWVVFNMTTNAPPSVGQGIAYVVGSSPTGAWAGNALKIAIREASGTGDAFAIYTPAEGWTVYDQDTNSYYRWTGSAWASASGAFIDHKSVKTDGTGSATNPAGTTVYSYSTSVAPTTGVRKLIDEAGLTFTAKKANAELIFRYRGDFIFDYNGGGAGDLVIALFRDSESNAVDWVLNPGHGYLNALTSDVNFHLEVTFKIAASDALQHTYNVALLCRATASNVTDFAMKGRRFFTIDEVA